VSMKTFFFLTVAIAAGLDLNCAFQVATFGSVIGKVCGVLSLAPANALLPVLFLVAYARRIGAETSR
jgi:hypothetical protein